MNLSNRFTNEWQAMGVIARDNAHARRALLEEDRREVHHEMILQECKEGKKSRQKIADEYNVDISTVFRITYKRKKEDAK